jgi:asparagine synthase (glutamine-hydrolysing)
MSAIAGIYYLDGHQVDRPTLERMVASLAHRGPDGSGMWTGGSVGLGHLKLVTTQESISEHLPCLDPTGAFAITADARIDNKVDLVDQLDLRCPEPVSDSALILRAYERWGERCPERLVGDFAFVIWDARRRRLFGARDHFGVKPFYYFSSDRVFAFATEIKALLCLRDVSRRLNETRIGDYLAGIFADCESTFYRDVRRLPPGHAMTLGCGQLYIRPYWALDPSRDVRLKSDGEYAEAFREIFTEAVRCRLRSARPVGSLLSGGLDSSSISCVARNLLDHKLPTFSAVFDHLPQCDERDYIRAVLDQGGFEPRFLSGDVGRPLADLGRIHWHEDQPFYGPNFPMAWRLYGKVRDEQVRVLLDGHDGDSTVSHGFNYINELAAAGRWWALAVESAGLARRFDVSPKRLLSSYIDLYRTHSVWWNRALLKRIRRVLRRAAQSGRRNASGSAATARLSPIRPEFIARVGLAERYRAWWQTLPDAAQTERDGHFRTLIQAMQPFALEIHDGAAAAFSIEPRYPFWDKRLVEFCLALPSKQKIRRGWTRYVLRRAMKGILPEKVRWRGGKTDFTPNLFFGLRQHERATLDDLFLTAPDVIEAFVDLPALRESYRRFLALEKARDLDDVMTIWKVASLAIWLRSAQDHHHSLEKDSLSVCLV